MIHGIITFIICLFVATFNLPIFFYALPLGFYLGREVAQAEYRYIEGYCNKKRENFKTSDILKAEAWTTKGLIDWIIPAVISLVFVMIRISF